VKYNLFGISLEARKNRRRTEDERHSLPSDEFACGVQQKTTICRANGHPCAERSSSSSPSGDARGPCGGKRWPKSTTDRGRLLRRTKELCRRQSDSSEARDLNHAVSAISHKCQAVK